MDGRLYGAARHAVPPDRRRLIWCEASPLNVAYAAACRLVMAGVLGWLWICGYDGSIRLLRGLAKCGFDVRVLCGENLHPVVR